MIIKRGEVWLVNLAPTVGAEIRKTRPVVIVNSDAIGALPIRLVAPITEWKEYFAQNVWHVKLIPDNQNGLTKTSAVDVLQLRGIDTQRFAKKIGDVSPDCIKSIVAGIAAIVEYSLV
jgi:mRNA interferase MazF